MDFVLGGVTKILHGFAVALPGFHLVHDFAADVAAVMEYLQKANAILPVAAAMAVLSLYVTVQVAMAVYYWINRAINLIRGAG